LRFLKLGGGPLNLGEVPKVEVPCITERSLNFMEVKNVWGGPLNLGEVP
jgi:hypothetical protein